MKKLRFPPSGPRALSPDMFVFVSSPDQEQQYRSRNEDIAKRVAAIGRDPLWTAAAMAQDLYREGLRARDIEGSPDLALALEVLERQEQSMTPEERARAIVRGGVSAPRRGDDDEPADDLPPRNREERRAARAAERNKKC